MDFNILKKFNCKTTFKTFEILIQGYNDLFLWSFKSVIKLLPITRKYILIFSMGQIVNLYLKIKKDKKFPI